ncbi:MULTISPECIES: glycerophosphoryl diester phosphodiesterase membrane domain-containing protein [unclassified Streptomyces]|uniref:glycerophosphoryl diester phosphodiesterase membrane domain-containing protein n=1 Tax=unclassified Streptomyces TaxID=2593676 RepID=UPI0037F6F517
MNDSPGWASPGSAPSDGDNSGAPTQPEPSDRARASSKWSQDQPPAAQWSAPGAGQTPPPPAPGWGGPQQGHGGWGQVPRQPPGGNWNQNYGRPPAAKPGVIPLRPLGVGEILDGAVSTARAHWRTVLGLTLTVAVISQLAQILATRFILPAPATVDPNATGTEAVNQAFDALRSSLIDLTPPLIIGQLATLFTTAVLTIVVSRSVLGRPVSLGDAWTEARPRLLSLLGLLSLLFVMLAAIMAVGILPGVLIGGGGGAALAVLGGLAASVVALWLYIRFSLASPALMLERQSIVQSLRRSTKLVNGSWWRIFGIMLLTSILMTIVSMIIVFPFSAIAMAVDSNSFSDILNGGTPQFGWAYLIVSGIGAVIASAITYPIAAGVSVLLYIDQRIRREALDLELARAAGVPGYETPGS